LFWRRARRGAAGHRGASTRLRRNPRSRGQLRPVFANLLKRRGKPRALSDISAVTLRGKAVWPDDQAIATPHPKDAKMTRHSAPTNAPRRPESPIPAKPAPVPFRFTDWAAI